MLRTPAVPAVAVARPRATFKRGVRARAEKQETKSTSPDDLNDSASGDMKYVLREDMSNLTTTPNNQPDTLPEAVQDSLEPRVRELRGKKLSQGTSDVGGAFDCTLLASAGAPGPFPCEALSTASSRPALCAPTPVREPSPGRLTTAPHSFALMLHARTLESEHSIVNRVEVL